MLTGQQGEVCPKMKDVVVEASRALANIDAERLEELALSCKALNREQKNLSSDHRARFVSDVIDSRQELALLGSVLDATRANLRVLRHLQAMRVGLVGYAGPADRN